MKTYLLLITLLFTLPLFSQGGTPPPVTGTVLDATDNSPLVGAVIKLTGGRQNTTSGAISDKSGKFSLTDIRGGRFFVEVSFVGYKTYTDSVTINRENRTLGTIKLNKDVLNLAPVQVTGTAIIAEQKEDTIQYNAAAFKTPQGSNAEDLVTKVPGITKEDGVIKAQGEEVKRVFVDGKPFFGDDPQLTLRNLPADVVDKIQVYDRMSDQAQFTGFDDGNSSKAINIVTRQDKRSGKFGKLYGGLGDNSRFNAGGTLNFFTGTDRITLSGLANNVNQQNFSRQDILGLSGSSGGGGGRGGFGGGGGGRRGGAGFSGFMGPGADNFLIATQEGINKTYSVGSNYSGVPFQDFQLSGSYFFNATDNNNSTVTQRTYLNALSGQTYNENAATGSKGNNHRLNFRAEYALDTLNSFVFTPRITFQGSDKTTATSAGNTSSTGTVLNSVNGNTASTTNGYTMTGELLMRHKFFTPGRTLSLSLNGGLNDKTGDARNYSVNSYTKLMVPAVDTLNQKSITDGNGYNYSANLNYTEGLTTASQLQFTAAYNSTFSQSDKQTKSFNQLTGLYDRPDTLYSNKYENKYNTLNGGLSYRYAVDGFNAMAGLSWQRSELDGNKVFPYSASVRKSFTSFLPSVRLQYRQEKTTHFRLQYNASANAPSIDQLQDVVDNSNPLFLKTGNPQLKEELTHRVMLNGMNTNLQTGSTVFGGMIYSYTNNIIANVTYLPSADTVIDGIKLSRGTQLSVPRNISSGSTLRGFGNYGYPVPFLRGVLNTNAGISYTDNPAVFNTTEYRSRSITLNGGLQLSGQTDEFFEYRLGYNPTYIQTRNTLPTVENYNYVIHTGGASVYYQFAFGLFVRTDFAYYYNTGLEGSLKRDYTLLNGAIGMKMFADNSGELKLEVFDAMKKNSGNSRNLTDTYTEFKTSDVLTRYYMLTFTWNLRRFGGGEGQGPGGMPPGGPPMGPHPHD